MEFLEFSEFSAWKQTIFHLESRNTEIHENSRKMLKSIRHFIDFLFCSVKVLLNEKCEISLIFVEQQPFLYQSETRIAELLEIRKILNYYSNFPKSKRNVLQIFLLLLIHFS